MTVAKNRKYLDIFQKISKIGLETADLNEMLSRTLEEMLTIFCCDRAWLLYPCDPHAPSWHVPMERTRPDWPGALAMDLKIPMTPDSASVFKSAIKTEKPVCYDNESLELPQSAKNFSVRSQMVYAIRPKVDAPWLLGIHHCSSAHAYKEEEIKLLEEIGRRIGESLNSLISISRLKESESYNRMLFEQSPIGLALRHIDGSFIDLNESFLKIIGRNRDEMGDLNYRDIIPNDYRKVDEQHHKKIEKTDLSLSCEMEYLHKNGDKIPVRCTSIKIHMDNQLNILSSVEDISERKRVEREMQKLSSAVEQSAEGVLITNHKGIIEYVNPTFEKMTGYTTRELMGKTPAILKSGFQSDDYYKNLWSQLLKGQIFEATLINRRKNGEFYHQKETITPLKNDSGEISSFLCICRDVTEEVKIEERLQHMAYHDQLTELPNRSLFRDRVEQAIRKASRKNVFVPVIFIDLDKFKDINDTLGHKVGDILLRDVARRLKSVIREGDTVARIGGDEFTVLLEEMATLEGVSGRAALIVEALERAFDIEDHKLYVTASVGIAIYPSDAQNMEDLFRAADTAMYRSKGSGGNRYRFFTPHMASEVMKRVTLEHSLREAIEKGEFLLHYQPRVLISEKRISSVEALLRWNSPLPDTVSPAEFIQVLEETGMIVPVGEWALKEACRQLKVWQDANYHMKMAVNISPRQFWDGSLAELVENCLHDYGIERGRLELEISETVVTDKSEKIIETFRKLEALGVTIAIDDFGKGFSSLSYLKSLPIHTLKIDRSFMEGINEDADHIAIAEAIISLGRTLRLSVTAEGVENKEQLDFLIKAGCNEAQGTLFTTPVPADALIKWIKQSSYK